MFIGLISFVAIFVFLVMGVVSKIKKKDTAKRNFLLSGGSFVVLLIAIIASPDPEQDTNAGGGEVSSPAATTVASQDPKAADEVEEAKKKAEAEAAAKAAAEAEAKVKAEEEAKKKENTIDGNGIFVVNTEVKPGLYKSDGSIVYWARLAGFSGELDDIIANGNPSGPEIVEIKASDKGFETMGFGNWIRIDDNYSPETVTEFGDGTYIVGKDIEPGTYKSDGSVIYWARLSNFSGELEAVIANGTPDGPAIVEISPSDKGFQTVGGGTWTKIE